MILDLKNIFILSFIYLVIAVCTLWFIAGYINLAKIKSKKNKTEKVKLLKVNIEEKLSIYIFINLLLFSTSIFVFFYLCF